MTKHALARFFARNAGELARRGAVRKRKRWLAKKHRRAIAAALLAKKGQAT